MKTPRHTSIMLGVNATAANTLSIENAMSINSTRQTVAQKLRDDVDFYQRVSNYAYEKINKSVYTNVSSWNQYMESLLK